MRFYVMRTLDDGDYQCKSEDASLEFVLKPELFPVEPHRYQEFIIVYDEVNYRVEVAPPCPEAHPEIKQRIRDLVHQFKTK